MRITPPMAHYLLALTTALANNSPVQAPLTCLECGRAADLLDDEHLTGLMPDGTPVVLVGCEGYMLVDPATLGLNRGNWQRPEQPF